MLTKKDIDWLKSELVPALSDQVKKDLHERLDWVAMMLDKQSGNLQSIQTELALIRGSLDTSDVASEKIKRRIDRIEKKLALPSIVD